MLQLYAFESVIHLSFNINISGGQLMLKHQWQITKPILYLW